MTIRDVEVGFHDWAAAEWMQVVREELGTVSSVVEFVAVAEESDAPVGRAGFGPDGVDEGELEAERLIASEGCGRVGQLGPS